MRCSLVIWPGVKIPIVRKVCKGSVVEDFVTKRLSKFFTGHILNNLKDGRKRGQEKFQTDLPGENRKRNELYIAKISLTSTIAFNEGLPRGRGGGGRSLLP